MKKLLKKYLLDCVVLLVVLSIGFYVGRITTNSEPIIVVDTLVIRDTVLVQIPPLSRESVLAELKKQNVPHYNIVLHQSLLETGHYTSKLSKTHNNIFGIRKNSKEYQKYDSYIDCIADYKLLISSKYKGGDYYTFLMNIGYAEDEEYINKLKRMG